MEKIVRVRACLHQIVYDRVNTPDVSVFFRASEREMAWENISCRYKQSIKAHHQDVCVQQNTKTSEES